MNTHHLYDKERVCDKWRGKMKWSEWKQASQMWMEHTPCKTKSEWDLSWYYRLVHHSRASRTMKVRSKRFAYETSCHSFVSRRGSGGCITVLMEQKWEYTRENYHVSWSNILGFEPDSTYPLCKRTEEKEEKRRSWELWVIRKGQETTREDMSVVLSNENQWNSPTDSRQCHSQIQ